MEYQDNLALIKDGNKEHINLLKRGAEFWNQWRAEHSSIVPNLNWANLCRADLRHFDLSRTSLSKADLRYVDLTGANLSEANLIKADLSGANLSHADLSKANLLKANLSGANISDADLSKANLSGATLRGTDLSKANHGGANLNGAILTDEAMSGETILGGIEISKVDFSNVDVVFFRDILSKTFGYVGDRSGLATVQFTAYYPRDAKVNTRYSFLLYAHTKEATEYIEKDIKKFKDELGNKVPPPKTAKQTTQIRPNTQITVVPECGQMEFDPPSLTKKWGGGWTRFGFDFKPTEAVSSDTLFVRVSIQIATVEVAHIRCAVEVIAENTESPQHIAEVDNPLAEANLNSSTSYLYQVIFISYSRKDKEVIKVYKLVQEAVGNVAFMDTYSIRAGEDWRSALARAIDHSDIFQLFWSENSAQSENVHDEWEYALKHKCPETRCVGFIRPVCWNDPIKPSPPEELGHLNFKYVPLDNLVTSRTSED